MDSNVASIPLLNFSAYGSALCVAGSAYLLGRLALLPLSRSAPLKFASSTALSLGLGLAILPVLVLAVGQVPGLVLRVPWALLGLAGGALWMVEAVGSMRSRDAGLESDSVAPSENRAADFCVHRLFKWIGWFFVAVSLALVFVRQLGPPLAYDALEYHVGVIPHYFQFGAIAPIPHVFYSAQPIATEMLYALASFVEGNPWGGGHGIVQWGLVALAASLLALTLARLGTPRALVPFLVLLFLHHPIVILVEMDRMTDLTGAIFMMAAWLLILETGSRPGASTSASTSMSTSASASVPPSAPPFAPTFALLGLLAAGTISSKWTNAGTAAPAVILPALFLMFANSKGGARRSEDSGRPPSQNPVPVLLASMAGFASIMVPWMAWVGVHTGNPFAPFAAGIFPTERWGPEHQAFLMETHGAVSPLTSFYWTNLYGRLTSISVDLWPLVLAILLGATAIVFRSPSGPQALRTPRTTQTARDASSSDRRSWLHSPRNVLAICCALSLVISWLLWGRLSHAALRFLTPTIPMQLLLVGFAAYWLFEKAKAARSTIQLGLVQSIALILATLPASSGQLGLWGNTRALIPFVTSPLVPGEVERLTLGATAELFDAANDLPQGSKLLAMGEARRYPFRHPILVSTVFDNHDLRAKLAELAQAVDQGKSVAWAVRNIVDVYLGEGFTHILVNEFEIARLLDFHAPPSIADDPRLEGKRWREDAAWMVETYPGYVEFGVQALSPTEREIYVRWLATLRDRAIFVTPRGATSPAMWIAPLARA